MLEALKNAVYLANIELVQQGLVTLTWGNASGLSEDGKFVVIKPSGVSYAQMSPEDMVVVDLGGNLIEGKWKPSSDTPTHLYLYKRFSTWTDKDGKQFDTGIKGIVHTHSNWATVFSQARQELQCFGTTHADHFYGTVPLTRPLMRKEVEEDYELNTGVVIVERFADKSERFPIRNHVPKPTNPVEMPAVLVAGHGPFTWGKDAADAVKNAVALESVAKMAYGTKMLMLEQRLQYSDLQLSTSPGLEDYVLQKHYNRKHGANAYYGQEYVGDR
ncbi:MAG: L-ribulose-5-phosphate 4-epimerase AraD [Thermoguttaceae bacterium]